MKKYQFYCVLISLICVCVLFLMCSTIVFGHVVGLLHTNMDVDVLAIFSVCFLIIGRILAPLTRNCCEDAYEG